MFTGTDWISDWPKAETFTLLIGEICVRIPMRGSWEPNDRIAYAMASFRLAQEHHSSIHLLISNDRCASARALARLLVEAGLRTVWFLEEVSDQEIIAIARGREKLPTLGELNRPHKATRKTAWCKDPTTLKQFYSWRSCRPIGSIL
jgi:hypothetical protein